MLLCGDLITTMMTCGSLLDPIQRTPGWCWIYEVKIRLILSDRDLLVLNVFRVAPSTKRSELVVKKKKP